MTAETTMLRASGRAANAMRPVTIQRHYTCHAEGSVLVSFGGTKVLCTASVEEKVPPHKRGSGQGWVTAEYGMLPRATHTRSDREAARGKQSGRTQEIQRLIGRSLRCVFDLGLLGERTIALDCDVLQADGGTRTAAITGAFVAAHDAVSWLLAQGKITQSPIRGAVAILDAQKQAFEYEGELAPDAALNPNVMKNYPFSRLTAPANVLVMPGLQSANISAKLLRELAGNATIGPMLIGMEKPVQIAPMTAIAPDVLTLAVLAAAGVCG